MANFLSGFPPVNTETWEHAIHEDLKGADYAGKLIWRSPEGIDLKPYYRAEDIVTALKWNESVCTSVQRKN